MVIVESSLDDQVSYMDRLLYAWAQWAWCTNSQLGFPAAGVIWGVKTPVEDRKLHELAGTDDMFGLVDRAVAQLSWPKRKRLFVHYWQDETEERKGQRFGETRYSYRRRIRELQIELYDALLPDVEDWRRSIL